MNKTLTQLPSSILGLGEGKYRIQSEAKVSVGETQEMESLSKRIKQLLNFPHLFWHYRKMNKQNTIGKEGKCR
jgi:hypothetical protein